MRASRQGSEMPVHQLQPPGDNGDGNSAVDSADDENSEHESPEDLGSVWQRTMDGLVDLRSLLGSSLRERRAPPMRHLSGQISSLTRAQSQLFMKVASETSKAAEDAVLTAASTTYEYIWTVYVSTAAVWAMALTYLAAPAIAIYIVLKVPIDWNLQIFRILLDDVGFGVAIFDYLSAAFLLNYPLFYILQFSLQTWSAKSLRQLGLSIIRVTSALILTLSCCALVAHATPRPVLIAMMLIYFGATGIWYCLTVDIWKFYHFVVLKDGLLQFLPVNIQRLLLERTLLDWLTDTTLFEQLKIYLPFFFALDKQETQLALDHMPHDVRNRLQRRGLLGEFPRWMQKLLSPDYVTEIERVHDTLNPSERQSFRRRSSIRDRSRREAGFTFSSPSPSRSSQSIRSLPNSGESMSPSSEAVVLARSPAAVPHLSIQSPVVAMSNAQRSSDSLRSLTRQSDPQLPLQPVAKAKDVMLYATPGAAAAMTMDSFMMRVLNQRISGIARSAALSLDGKMLERVSAMAFALTAIQVVVSRHSRTALFHLARTVGVSVTALLAVVAFLLRLLRLRYDLGSGPNTALVRFSLFWLSLFRKKRRHRQSSHDHAEHEPSDEPSALSTSMQITEPRIKPRNAAVAVASVTTAAFLLRKALRR